MEADSGPRAQGRIAVDIGGTFTDIICCVPGRDPIALKVLSTPDNYARSVIDALRALIDDADLKPVLVGLFVHATTVATNAVLERKGATAALLTTAGFRDVLEIGRLRLPVLYELGWRKPPALIPRHRVYELAQRTAADGAQRLALDLDAVRDVMRHAVAEGVTSVAVSFLHSYANPTDEDAVAQLIHIEFPGVHVSQSSTLVREIREFERTSTAVVDAYVKPVVHRYLSALEAGVKEQGVLAPIQLMQSGGGLMDLRAAARQPVPLLVSAGTAVVFSSTLWHRSSPNLSDRIRRQAEIYELGISPGSMGPYLQSIRDLPAAEVDCKAAMIRMHYEMLGEGTPRFREFFTHLVAGDGPFMIMCSAGKDRTGVAAALLLSALGVPRETMLEDYLISADVYRDKELVFARNHGLEALGVDLDLVKDVFTVHPEYLKAVLQRIDETAGSMEAFISETLGLAADGRQSLRDACLDTWRLDSTYR